MTGLADQPVREALEALASPARPAAAGVASALAGAAAGSLAELTASLAAERLAGEAAPGGEVARLRELADRAAELRQGLLASADEDVLAYSRVPEAGDDAARAAALSRASDPPLGVAEAAAQVAEAAAEVARAGRWAFSADAVVAAELATAAAVGAARLVAVNLAGRSDDPRPARAREAAERARRASDAAAESRSS